MSINILPWRDKKQKQHCFGVILLLFASLLMIYIISFSYCFYMKNKYQLESIQYEQWIRRNADINLNDFLLSKNQYDNMIKLVNKIKIIRDHQIAIFSIWSILNESFNKNIRLISFQLTHDQLILEGESSNSQSITTLVSILQKNSLFCNVLLNDIHLPESIHTKNISSHAITEDAFEQKTIKFSIQAQVVL